MKIIGVETSSTLFSLAVHEDDKLLYEITRDRHCCTDSRDAGLFLAAHQLFDEFQPTEIEALAISIGPGMFTSLRVGLSLVKGLALAHGIPIVAVNTLDIIGIPLSFADMPVFAVINAFHEELYAAAYKSGKNIIDYQLTRADHLLGLIKEQSIVAGPGVLSFKKQGMPDNTKIRFINEAIALPSATKLIHIALPRIKTKDYDDVEMLEPFYIKKTDAERNYNKKNAL